MARVKLQRDKQKIFLNEAAKYFDFDWSKIAKISNICERTLNDWRREKSKMRYEALLRLHRISKIPVPKIIDVLPEYWSTKKASRLGAIKRNELYGNPGTPEGRRKGGINSQRLFQINPEYARKLGIKVRKIINIPKISVELAEFTGIMLGDGGISDYQINITFNRETDAEHGVYIQKLIRRLFSVSTLLLSRPTDKADRIIASGKNLVEFLEKEGLKKGNKVGNQVDIPEWVLANKNYKAACLRGLIDTDGSFYLYKHKVSNKIYCNFAMCFTNHSKPLLKSVYKILKDFQFHPVNNTERVYLHKKEDAQRYFTEIGTHNPKHLQKYKNWVAVKSF